MKPAAAVAAFEDALRALGVRVRRERGAFRGDRCTVAGREVVVLNRLHPPEAQALVLAGALRALPHETLYLRPAVRAALQDAWAQLDAGAGLEASGASEEGDA